jgi:ABC-type transport system involved in cytochrome c biogenesis ATPase subunit
LTDVAAPMVAIGGVTKRYGRTLAVDAVSFAVQPNELFALLGPNGAGKTTLLHVLCTILKPDSGSAAINGVDVVAHPREARRNIGVVFQEPSLDDRLTVYADLNFHGLVYGVPAARRQSRIDELLALVELAGWRDSLVRTLSSGMKRRLEIARALRAHHGARRALARAVVAARARAASQAPGHRHRHHPLHRGDGGVRPGLHHRSGPHPRQRHAGGTQEPPRPADRAYRGDRRGGGRRDRRRLPGRCAGT